MWTPLSHHGTLFCLLSGLSKRPILRRRQGAGPDHSQGVPATVRGPSCPGPLPPVCSSLSSACPSLLCSQSEVVRRWVGSTRGVGVEEGDKSWRCCPRVVGGPGRLSASHLETLHLGFRASPLRTQTQKHKGHCKARGASDQVLEPLHLHIPGCPCPWCHLPLLQVMTACLPALLFPSLLSCPGCSVRVWGIWAQQESAQLVPVCSGPSQFQHRKLHVPGDASALSKVLCTPSLLQITSAASTVSPLDSGMPLHSSSSGHRGTWG